MTGFEPATPRATTWCSAKLSYIHQQRKVTYPQTGAKINEIHGFPIFRPCPDRFV